MGKYKHEKEKLVTGKALGCCNEDCEILGIEHSHININLPALMMEKKDEDCFVFPYKGKDYYFCKEAVKKVDDQLLTYWKYGIACTAVLLNAPKLFDSRQEKALLKKVIHPDFEWDVQDAFISAFPMKSTESKGYFEAFIAFLSNRYMSDKAEYGRLTGFIISNEVNSQCVWGNAGSKPVEVYTKEYTEAVKAAFDVAREYWEYAQIYISLDHHWTEGFRPFDTNRCYGGKYVLDFVNKYAKEMGDFEWGVAYHPYPEALNYPDFYNDRIPTFYFDTRIITFKNIEVLDAYLGQEEFLYKGKKRNIVFSEQGFNARSKGFVEKQCAASYVLAYQKMKKLSEVQWMTHHAYLDNPHEFGLHLGIREVKADGSPGRKRPIYKVIRAMGTDEEQKYVEWARKFIGKQLFDELLSPEIHCENEGDAKATDFGD
ncbi:MAG: hypothetical protein K6G87_06430 [Butyrivibrio sp.]|uniref:DUF5722 domain-containing protein n=1 Tax=Butyrivibrio sp. TaxID=28121 RepID=UPI0025EF60C2|nr:DUF5722 domain-containing protein [Butyrivibrio sp.]MCR5770855.1 hypothetical protein [Butyrivibrio sp.]